MTDPWPQLGAKRIDLAEEQDFAVGGMHVSPARLTAEQDGERAELQPRVMQVLVALARARSTVVSRDRLVDLCWEGRIVGNDALNRCILALRHLAQRFTPAPFVIETVPRVGHRLVECSGSVIAGESNSAGETAISAEPPLRRRGQAVHERRVNRRAVLAGGAVATAAVSVMAGWRVFDSGGGSPSESIAVLPFANLSGDSSKAYFSDGIAEELRNALSRISGLKVVGRTSSEAVRDHDAKAAARKLGVWNVLTGSVRQSSSTIRVSAQLVDGHDGVENWQQTTAGAAGAPVTPWWGSVTPWGIDAGNQFRPDAPPDINSAAFAAALAEVQAIGDVNSVTRTAFQTQSAQYWATGGNGLAPWINAAVGAADGMGLTSLQYAELFAALTTNVADATIGVFDAKYTFDFWRPTTAIHDADPNSTWTSLITAPNHPSYISGHSAVGAAAADTISYYLGADTDLCFTGFTCFGSALDAAHNGADSRLWGGIHYSFDNQAGFELGHRVAQFNLAQGLFQAVPEPESWLMMLLGFGLIGWTIRRQRSEPTVPA